MAPLPKLYIATLPGHLRSLGMALLLCAALLLLMDGSTRLAYAADITVTNTNDSGLCVSLSVCVLGRAARRVATWRAGTGAGPYDASASVCPCSASASIRAICARICWRPLRSESVLCVRVCFSRG
jgi:hypothetical protein